jgi:hypothetical protein
MPRQASHLSPGIGEASIAIVMVLAGVAANDPYDGVVRGLLEGGAFLGGRQHDLRVAIADPVEEVPGAIVVPGIVCRCLSGSQFALALIHLAFTPAVRGDSPFVQRNEASHFAGLLAVEAIDAGEFDRGVGNAQREQ